jgi:ketosteroid isomerase-like protein
MSDRDEIVELTSNLGLLVDARDWDAVQRLFCETVDVDYTSLNGGEPASMPPADLVGGWREMLERLQATQHLIAGQVVRVDGDEATAAANVTATHVRPNASGGPHWVVGGRYDFGLRRTDGGWRISALTLIVAWATGNQQILQP